MAILTILMFSFSFVLNADFSLEDFRNKLNDDQTDYVAQVLRGEGKNFFDEDQKYSFEQKQPTSLWLAASNGHLRIVDLIIKNFINLEAQEALSYLLTNYKHVSAYHTARSQKKNTKGEIKQKYLLICNKLESTEAELKESKCRLSDLNREIPIAQHTKNAYKTTQNLK